LVPNHIINTKKALELNSRFFAISCYRFTPQLIFVGFEDGLISVYNHKEVSKITEEDEKGEGKIQKKR
jgi:hypothetical protein